MVVSTFIITKPLAASHAAEGKSADFVLLEQDDVKGIGILENGDLVYIYPDGLVELWNSTWINRLDDAGNVTEIKSNQGRFYKLRIWNPNYQY